MLTPPHVVGSDTSLAAAESINAADIRSGVLDAIRRSGDRGMTCDEIENAHGWLHQTVSARVRELAKTCKIVDSGDRRKTRSGRFAAVYRAKVAT